jgi:phosphoribosylformylglycinamidine synthase
MGQIVRTTDGMAEACAALDFPVVSGNVSLYNETNGAAIPPTPAVGGVGLLADSSKRADFSGLKPGDALVLIGETRGELGQSMYLRECLGREDGAPPPVDLALEKRHGDFIRSLIQSGQISVVHDLSDGGLIAAVCEMALASGVGAQLQAPEQPTPAALFFGEDQGRYLIATRAATALLDAAAAADIPATVIGEACNDVLACPGVFSLALERLRQAHEGWMPAYMGA